VYTADVDGDGDMDILGASDAHDEIVWFENEGGSGTSWFLRTVDESFYGAMSVRADDVDGDGDTDILGAANDLHQIAWWENLDTWGTAWVKHAVVGGFFGAWCVSTADIDGDGDRDILGAATSSGIRWWENEDGVGHSWQEHIIKAEFSGAMSVYSADMDDDGDADVLGAASGIDEVTWWENANGAGTYWVEHMVEGESSSSYCVFAADIDGDGDMDPIASGTEIAWWDLSDYTYSTYGYLESSVLDTEVNPNWGSLQATTVTPPMTSVSFQVRASDSYTEMGEWSDTLAAPCDLAGVLEDGDRFFQYRTILRTWDTGTTPELDDVTVSWDPLGAGESPQAEQYALLGPRSNPSPAYVTIRLTIPEASSVELEVFDISGRRVCHTGPREYCEGLHCVPVGELSSGVYFCRMRAGGFAATGRFVVIDL
jgi:hypothetical protein